MTDEEGEILKSEVSRLEAKIHSLVCQIDQLRSMIPVVFPMGEEESAGGGGEVEVKGVDTDGNETSAVATKSITFTTGDDSKVGFVVDDAGDGNVTVAVDVYWK